MKISPAFYRWLARQNHNYPVVALATFTAPRVLMRSIYNQNRDRGLWGDKKGCITLSFDCDYPEDAEAIPQVVEMMKQYPFKASFAAVGYWLERYTAQHEPIVREGHELLNHTWSHPDNELLNPGRKFREISTDEKAEEVTRCHELCQKLLGVSPTGFRVPHFKNLFTPDIYGILKNVGYKYSSSTWLTNTTTYGLPFYADHGIVEFPLSTSPGYPFTVFDTWRDELAELRLQVQAARPARVPQAVPRAAGSGARDGLVHGHLHGSARREEDSGLPRDARSHGEFRPACRDLQ